jgi:hypothetical protein
METPRLLSEYCAARSQSAGCISANAGGDVAKSSAKIDNGYRLPMRRRRKGRAGSTQTARRKRDHAHPGAIEVNRPCLAVL